MTLRLNSKVEYVKGIGTKYLQILNNNGIYTVLDLLLHFPIIYIDFSRIITSVEIGRKNLYRVKILNFSLSRHFSRRISVLKVNAQISQEKIQIGFFNKPYLKNTLKKNQELFIYGTFEKNQDIVFVNNPLVFFDVKAEMIFPLYSKIALIKSGILKKIIYNCLEKLRDDFECLPQRILAGNKFPGIVSALKNIHFPETYNPDQISLLKRRFIYTEFLLFQLELQYIRNYFTQVPRASHYKIGERIKEFIRKNLTFELTPDQWKACDDIILDLKKGVTMQRLLQGDVGTGKTIIAFIALLLAEESGYQGAFLAPTEILASQHFLNGKTFFKSSRLALLTGSTTLAHRNQIQKEVEDGRIKLLFGTHALLNEKIQFKNLGMVVIDEQHRFGVSQRAALFYKGKSVDLLVTTATPIPRTMLLSLYNDLSVSMIKTKPKGRLPIITKVVDSRRREEFYLWLREKIKNQNKAYIILPLIEDSEFFPELRSIKSESIFFKEIFKDYPLAFISGKTSAAKKESRLKHFIEGKVKVLISTTVIEVGIDVKDVTYMVIENADHYGLSQLHQLRGRVGRGEFQSFCYLFFSPNVTENGEKRLRTIVNTADGFEVAEIDLKMRGGGLVSGLEQSGYLDFKLGDMQKDLDIFKDARQDAALILKDNSLHNTFLKNFLAGLNKKVKNISFS